MVPQTAHARRSPRRSGFTLIELLVVLAIITVLLSISWVVYGAAVENARISATRATIRQLDSALQERLTAFSHVNLKTQAQLFKANYDAAGNTPAAVEFVPLEVAEIMVRKDRFRALFPQREQDLWGLNGVQETPPTAGDDSPLLRRMWNPTASDWKTDSWRGRNDDNMAAPLEVRVAAESSELLYVALTQGDVFGGTPLPLDRINSRHLGDTDGDKNPEFLDDWGKPLQFYNWATALVRRGGQGAQIELPMFRASATVLMPGVPLPSANPLLADVFSDRLNQDSDDPTGALSNAVLTTLFFTGSSTFNIVGIGACQPFNEGFYHALDTYSLPLIVAAGPDGDMGLFLPDGSDPRTPTVAATATEFPRRLAMPLAATAAETSLLDQLTDNITNRQP